MFDTTTTSSSSSVIVRQKRFCFMFSSLVSFVQCIKWKMWKAQKAVQFLLLPWLLPCGATARKAQNVLFVSFIGYPVEYRTPYTCRPNWNTLPAEDSGNTLTAKHNNRIVSSSKHHRLENENIHRLEHGPSAFRNFHSCLDRRASAFDNSFFFSAQLPVSIPLTSTTMN